MIALITTRKGSDSFFGSEDGEKYVVSLFLEHPISSKVPIPRKEDKIYDSSYSYASQIPVHRKDDFYLTLDAFFVWKNASPVDL
uniref:Uncharacterized protein n=1 Tax=Romanomermis culicivorax TaxID=13658 RepID=A0A915KEW8_ROMCU